MIALGGRGFVGYRGNPNLARNLRMFCERFVVSLISGPDKITLCRMTLHSFSSILLTPLF